MCAILFCGFLISMLNHSLLTWASGNLRDEIRYIDIVALDHLIILCVNLLPTNRDTKKKYKKKNKDKSKTFLCVTFVITQQIYYFSGCFFRLWNFKMIFYAFNFRCKIFIILMLKKFSFLLYGNLTYNVVLVSHLTTTLHSVPRIRWSSSWVYAGAQWESDCKWERT